MSDAWAADRIRAELVRMQEGDLPTHGGRTLAYVYDSGLAGADAIGREALAMFAASNGLDPTAFPSLLRMENELVGIAGRILDAPPGFAGSVTSGGTESILLAVLAARDSRPDVVDPTMVLPSTAHAAFHKAAHYFGVRSVVVPVDEVTFRADPTAMAAAIDDSTVLVVASAPSYAHGVVDPVGPVAAAAAAAGVRCHVDACIGGWVLPWLDRRDWTFTVPGVTSISVDLHKYAYTPKGVSVLLHRSAALRAPQLFASARWPGYTMLNSTTQSTRSGGPLAAAWAVVHAIGDDGYARLARSAREATLELARSVAAIDGLRVLAEPDSTLLAVTTDDDRIDVFSLADEMLARGWFVQPQMAFGSAPANLHLTLSAATAPSVPDFVAALADSVTAVRARGPVQVPAELAAAAATIDPATLDETAFDGLLRVAGLAGEGGALALPEHLAEVNALLDVTPPALREALLLAVLDRLLRPTS
jgi:glutamate/tyrosine decarboxylase-like PLP-dependent enzyme